MMHDQTKTKFTLQMYNVVYRTFD